MGNFCPGRPEPDEYAPYAAQYVALVEGSDILAALDREPAVVPGLVSSLSEERAGHRYAPEKWSVKQVVGHVADTERIFAYRALRIARGDQTPLAAFQQNGYVDAAGFDRRSLADLLHEFSTVRAASVSLLKSFDPEAWTRRGVASEHPVSVRALAYLIAGHELHHAAILKEKYL